MRILRTLGNMFSWKQTLDRVSVEELRRERLALEQMEQRLTREVDELERQKKELFTRGKDETSRRQQLAVARKIKQLDGAVSGKDQQLGRISKQIRVLNGLTTVKENETLTRQLGVSSILGRLDLESVRDYVERATVEGQFQMERFAEILKTVESDDGPALIDDAETLSIVEAMQEAKEAEADDPEAALERGMKAVEATLNHGATENEAGLGDARARSG